MATNSSNGVDKSLSAATSQNPTHLPARYEIEKLTRPEHSLWANAIVSHANVFYSTYLTQIHPDEDKSCRRFNDCITGFSYLMDHQIASGLSYGVFDTEYVYKRPESAKTDGQFYFDPSSESLSPNELLEQMDFPLVSVAMAYDGINPLDLDKMTPLFVALPTFPLVFVALNSQDKRDPQSWQPTGPKQVLMRAATATRRDYERKGLMGALARFQMRQAANEGFRAINIESASNGVKHVWMNPPNPFWAELVSTAGPDWEMTGEDGKVVKPHAKSQQELSKIHVHLK